MSKVLALIHKETETTVRRSYSKQVFLNISQYSQENTCEICESFKNAFFYKTPPVGGL